MELRHSHLRRDWSITNLRLDFEPMPARAKRGKGRGSFLSVGPRISIQPVRKSRQLLALVAERGELGPEYSRLLVNRQSGNNRVGDGRRRQAAARRVVVRQSGAGTDPNAAIRIGPKSFAVGVVPDQ